ncbi:MAG: heme exporter protein CcmD [Alphaproteobacteria bacterium]|nr:heme exporter protein CcmD [Alphaproteobacteria bacterium]
MNIITYLEMGGYAAYVWPAYGISLVALVGAVFWTLHAWRKVRRQLAMLEEMKEDER